jgi:hypothetical protein
MAKKRTELEARLLEEHGRVISVVQRWQSEQQAVDEVRASLADAEARLDEAVLEGADLGDRSMVARLLDLPEAQVRKSIAGARRAVKHRKAGDQSGNGESPSPSETDFAVDANSSSDVALGAMNSANESTSPSNRGAK